MMTVINDDKQVKMKTINDDKMMNNYENDELMMIINSD